MQIVLLEEEQDEQFLGAELRAGILVLPYNLPILFMVVEHSHCNHHRPLHELLHLETIGDLVLVYHLSLGLHQQHYLEEDTERLGQLAHFDTSSLDVLFDKDEMVCTDLALTYWELVSHQRSRILMKQLPKLLGYSIVVDYHEESLNSQYSDVNHCPSRTPATFADISRM
jgi:hypothetical protein